jgi:diacylglycerol kinase family enzyme
MDAAPMSPPRYHIVLNAKSGTAISLGLTAENLTESFAANGLAATVDADESASLEERVQRAIANEAEIIVSAGGDGTATALAQALAGTGKTLAILPLGTANLLARDLGLPLDLDATVAALSSLRPRQIDVGEVNKRVFLHQVVIGVVPAIARVREQMRGQRNLASFYRFVAYLVRRLTTARRMALAISSRDTNDRVERLQAIAVSNNALDQGFGLVFTRSCLDAGSLSLYTLRSLNLGDVLRLTIEMLMGRWHEDEALNIETVRSLTIRSKRPTLSVMIDGEVGLLETPLQFRIRPKALTVLAPVTVVAATAETDDDAILPAGA